jgi:hypothetical protein
LRLEKDSDVKCGRRPCAPAHTDTSFVETSQVAPTILQLLGLDPKALDAVRTEGTPVLSSLFESNHN